jgi:hypothetical protein
MTAHDHNLVPLERHRLRVLCHAKLYLGDEHPGLYALAGEIVSTNTLRTCSLRNAAIFYACSTDVPFKRSKPSFASFSGETF